MNSRMESKAIKVRTKGVSKVKQMLGGQSVGARNGKSEVSHQEVGPVQRDLKRGRKGARKKGDKLVGGKQENLE